MKLLYDSHVHVYTNYQRAFTVDFVLDPRHLSTLAKTVIEEAVFCIEIPPSSVLRGDGGTSMT